MKDMVQTAPARLGDKRQPDRRAAREEDLDAACREVLIFPGQWHTLGPLDTLEPGLLVEINEVFQRRQSVRAAARVLACANRKPSKRAKVHAELAKAVAR